MYRIIYPHDWETIGRDYLSVVVSGVFPADVVLSCEIWPAAQFFGTSPYASWDERVVLSRADLAVTRGGLNLFCLENLGDFGKCVVCIVDVKTHAILCAAGIHVTLNGQAETLQSGFSLRSSSSGEIHYPLEVVGADFTNFNQDLPRFPGEMERCLFEESADSFLRPMDPESNAIRIAMVHPVERHDAHDNFFVKFSHGTESATFKSLQQRTAWQTAATYYAMFPAATVAMNWGLVVSESRYIWGDSAFFQAFSNPRMPLIPGAFRLDGMVGLAETRKFVFDDTSAIPMILCNGSPHNYGHWTFNSLPAAYFMRDQIISGKVVLIAPKLKPMSLRSLEMIGITRSMIVELDDPIVHFPRVIYPSFLSTHANFNPGAFMKPCIEAVREAARRRCSGDTPEYIYFTRRGFAGGRVMENEDELIERLTAEGFQCVAPHEISLDECIYLASHAKIIVSQLGAALTDMIFAPPGCGIIEIVCDYYCAHNGDTLYNARLYDLRFVRIMEPVIPDSIKSTYEFRYRVSIDKVMDAVSNLQAGD